MCLLVLLGRNAWAAPYIELPKSGLSPEHIAVVFLKDSALSEKIARHYVQKRNIPQKNLVSIELNPDNTVVDPGKFVVAKKVLEARLPESIQAYALAWAQPYRVGCMSMTAAFSYGYNVQYCASSCETTRTSPYFHSSSTAPYTDFSIRPAMMLAADTFAEAQALIARGIRADNSLPEGKIILLKTDDKARTVRETLFSEVDKHFSRQFDVVIKQQNSVKDQRDILFYFTGSKHVEHLDTLQFMPGALADHLTSAGGMLTDSSQMSAMRWLEAGATASYGAAIEPCNFPQKFPNPLLAIWHYTKGATALEAYAKSVLMPGQGNFIGEPLSAPYRAYRLNKHGSKLRIYSPVLREGSYVIYSEDFGLEHKRGVQLVDRYKPYLEVEVPFSSRYRIERDQ